VSQHRITQFEFQLVVFLIVFKTNPLSVHCTDWCVVDKSETKQIAVWCAVTERIIEQTRLCAQRIGALSLNE